MGMGVGAPWGIGGGANTSNGFDGGAALPLLSLCTGADVGDAGVQNGEIGGDNGIPFSNGLTGCDAGIMGSAALASGEMTIG